MNTRNWSIRSKAVALLAVPLTALLALWVFATVLTVGPALNLLSARTLLDRVGRPAEALVAELQTERRLSLVYLARQTGGAALAGQRTRTDAAAAVFRREVGSEELRDAADEQLLTRIAELNTALEGLPAGRGFVDRREVDRSGALGLYSGVVDQAFRMFGAMATLEDPQLDREARALTGLGRAREFLARADSLVAGALTAGAFGPGEHGQLVQVVGTQRFLYADAVAELPQPDRISYQRLTEGASFVHLDRMQERLVAAGRDGAPAPVDAADWQSAYDASVQQLRRYEQAAADALADRAAPVAVNVLVRLGVAGVLGLAAVLLSLLVSARVGRSLIRRLGGLRGAALMMAHQGLPDVVARLRRGEAVDVATEAPPLEYGTDELGQLGNAFTEVQRTAVQSAVDEATLRRGLNEVFLNIARRSQTLLHRQLALLDEMERRSLEPAELEDLFRVDHLATRMRRHAEDLVILAGAAPGRGWRNPVSLIDVVRGAVSEVEDYRRVDVAAMDDGALAGRAVGDVIHLLAELMENATSFSPPHTRVRISGQLVPNGYAIEVEDRGLGMSADDLAAANRRLAEPTGFDPANSARLGLFVVSQLGTRHGVQVRLRPSPYGGVTAVALIPTALVVPADEAPPGGAPPTPLRSITQRPATLSAPEPQVRPGRVRSVPDGGPPAPEPAAPAGSPPTQLERRRRSTPRLAPVPARSVAGIADPGGPEAPAATTAGTQDPGATVRAGTATAPGGHDLVVPGAASDPAPGGQDPAAAGGGVPVAGAAGSTGRSGAIPVGPDGLPRRIRQTHLVPQLRERPPPVDPAAATVARSPDRARSLMTALQDGTARGRRAAADQPVPVDPSVRPGGPPDLPVRHAGVPADGGPPAQPPADPRWFTHAQPELRSGTAPNAGPPIRITWADADTARYPVAGGGNPDLDAGPAGAGSPDPHAGPVGCPPDPPPPAAPAAPASVVHHGEIVDRWPPAAPPPWPAVPPTVGPGPAGSDPHPESDE